MCQRKNGCRSKLDIPETYPDVDQHTENRNGKCPNRIYLHLPGNGTGNVFRYYLVFFNREFILNAVIELCPLFRRHRPCLYNDFIGSGNLCRLCGGISPGCFSKERNHLLINLRHTHILIKGNRSGRTAAEIQIIVKDIACILLVHKKHHKTEYDDQCGKTVSHFSETDEVDDLCFFLHAVQFRILRTEFIEGVEQRSRHKQCRNQGYNNTDGKGCCKASNRSRSAEVKHRSRNQGRNISVENSGKRLLKTCLDGLIRSLPVSEFFFDSGKDNDIRIHSHTDGEDDAGNTRKGKRDLEGLQKHNFQTDIQHQRNRGSQSRKPVNKKHEKNNQSDTDSCRLQRGGNGFYTECCSDYIGTKLRELNGKRTDTNRRCNVVCLLIGLYRADARLSAIDGLFDVRGRNHIIVIDNENAFSDIVLRRFRKFLRSRLGKVQLNDIFFLIVFICHSRRSRLYIITGQKDIPVFIGEFEGSRLSQFLQNGIGIRSTRDINVDSVLSFLINLCFIRIPLRLQLQFVDSVTHLLLRRVLVHSLIRDRNTAV